MTDLQILVRKHIDRESVYLSSCAKSNCDGGCIIERMRYVGEWRDVELVHFHDGASDCRCIQEGTRNLKFEPKDYKKK